MLCKIFKREEFCLNTNCCFFEDGRCTYGDKERLKKEDELYQEIVGQKESSIKNGE